MQTIQLLLLQSQAVNFYENDSIELDIFWFCSLSEEKTFSYFFTMQASHLKNKLIARVCMGFLTRFSREFRAK